MHLVKGQFNSWFTVFHQSIALVTLWTKVTRLAFTDDFLIFINIETYKMRAWRRITKSVGLRNKYLWWKRRLVPFLRPQAKRYTSYSE
jgi:hypothetical protein